MIPEDYGLILSKIDNNYTISVNRGKHNAIIILTVKNLGNETVNHIRYIKNNNLLFTWTDTIVSLEDKKFIRRIGKSIIHYEDGEISLYATIKKTSPIVSKKISNNKRLNHRFITMDLETITYNNILIPYLLCWYDGKIKKHYFISHPSEIKDYITLNEGNVESSVLAMVVDAMKDICKRKYKGYKIYLHNFSKFDGYFLIRYLSMLGVCEPIVHKGRIISCKFRLYESKYNVTFMDSYLMLPSSLKDLCKSFNNSKEDSKSIFPFLLNNINYQGSVPDYKYFSGISLEDYENYRKNFAKIWNFKEEAVKYCTTDCTSLYRILTKFNKLTFRKFKLNFTNYPTLPSLAFNLFTGKYLKRDTVHMLTGEVADNIRNSYTGGAVDMYLTKPPKGKKVFGYDVNSLYPYIMKNFVFPIGPPTYFQGNVLRHDPNAFGFFYCKISAPSYKDHPILSARVKTKSGTRTIFPTGNWEGMYFSEELYNAKKYGYEFEILWGYTFKKGLVFKDYVEDLYNLRLQYPKDNPMNLICKLLLNSLYGRFGMDDQFTSTKIISKTSYLEFENKYKEVISEIIDLGDNYLIQFKNLQIEIKSLLDSNRETHNVNIAIASAVTAYARIHMSQFKNNPNLPRLLYSDTDSAYFDGPLPDSFISNTILGALKLEGIYDNAVFLAPKVYALQNQDGTITKIKGLSKEAIINNNITLESLEALLIKDSNIQISKNKWFRHLDKGAINILEQIYTLKATGNKRELVACDSNDTDKLVGTTPFFVSNGELNKIKI